MIRHPFVPFMFESVPLIPRQVSGNIGTQQAVARKQRINAPSIADGYGPPSAKTQAVGCALMLNPPPIVPQPLWEARQLMTD